MSGDSLRPKGQLQRSESKSITQTPFSLVDTFFSSLKWLEEKISANLSNSISIEFDNISLPGAL